MAAIQVLASAAQNVTLPDAVSVGQWVSVQNLGPNPIYAEVNGTATVAGGTRIDPGDAADVWVAARKRLSLIAATADQVSPADTRVQVL